MILLLLIQFDAYGYDALNAMTQEAEYVSLYEETVDTNTEQTEWSDYRYRVVKQRAETEIHSYCARDRYHIPIRQCNEAHTSVHSCYPFRSDRFTC